MLKVNELHQSLRPRPCFKRISFVVAVDRVVLTLDDADGRPIDYVIQGMLYIDDRDREALPLPVRRLMGALGRSLCIKLYMMQRRLFEGRFKPGDPYIIAQRLPDSNAVAIRSVLTQHFDGLG